MILQALTQRWAPMLANQLRRILPPVSCKNFHFWSSPVNYGRCLPGTASNDLLKSLTPLVVQVAGFKVKGRLRRRCKDCYFVMRQERLYVICKTHPRHKQMAMKARDYKSWILTHATQSKVRPY